MGHRRVLLAAIGLGAALLGGCARDAGPDVSGPFAELPTPAGPGSSVPHLALTPAGTVVMSWLEPAADGAGHELRFATRSAD